MPKPRVVLAISPLPGLIGQAARTRGLWHELEVTGSKWIHHCVEKWIESGAADQYLVLLPAVREPAALNERLAALLKTGAGVEWFAPEESPSVRQALRGLKTARLHVAETAEQAFADTFSPGRSIDTDLSNPDLLDYLRYKVNLCFMRGMDTAPLLEAIECLAANGRKRFTLAGAAGADRRSVEQFREADFPYIEGQSEALMELKRRLVQVGQTDLNVLLLGETGTGKEFAAFYLHEFSPRRQGPLVMINCAGLDETFLRSELFGHEQGAFTGAIRKRPGLVKHAAGGTLFLDELAEMSLPVQADLLRFMQTRRFRPLGSEKEEHVDVRIVAGTQPSLLEKMRRHEFRDDLYYRVAEVTIQTPSLASVPEDINRIIRHMCYAHPGAADEEQIAATLDYFRKGDATLRKYAWPGNVRELVAMVRRRLQLGDDVLAELKRKMAQGKPGEDEAIAPPASHAQIRPLAEVTREYVRAAWEQRGSLSQQDLAGRLGVSVNTLKKHL